MCEHLTFCVCYIFDFFIFYLLLTMLSFVLLTYIQIYGFCFENCPVETVTNIKTSSEMTLLSSQCWMESAVYKTSIACSMLQYSITASLRRYYLCELLTFYVCYIGLYTSYHIYTALHCNFLHMWLVLSHLIFKNEYRS